MQSKKTRIFLDSGDSGETKQAIEWIGSIDGQTTNPSLVARNPEIKSRFEAGEKLSTEELLGEYKKIVTEISEMIPNGSVSIEVYADSQTSAEEMIEQAQEMSRWIPNAHIKLPAIAEGIKAQKDLLDKGIRVNMTLVFSQEQAAAIHLASGESITRGDVFVSPFIGRLDDIGLDGIDLIRNIQQMYSSANSNVEILAASLRSVEHLLYCFYLDVDIVTVPFAILKQWKDRGFPFPGEDISSDEFKNQNEFFAEIRENPLEDIEYKALELTKSFIPLNIDHELTTKGLAKFAEDWNKLLKA